MPSGLSNSKRSSPRSKALAELVTSVWSHYALARRDFPWRHPALKLRADGTLDPYRIMVSEVMLQQTQAGARTIEKYRAFIQRFPNTAALAAASLRDVYALWQGLGYNRRAKALRDAAKIVEEEYKGKFPDTIEGLKQLPGVGPYTASAVYVFAYNRPVVLIETNLRTVFIHHLFKGVEKVSDAELLSVIEKTLDHERPREWYSALMDYGAMLKKEHGNVSRRSAHYVRQSRFKGSPRELRGKLLRALLAQPHQSAVSLGRSLSEEKERVEAQLEALVREGFVVRQGRRHRLA